MEFNNVKAVAIYGTDCVVDISRGEDDTCRFISAKEKYFNVQNDNGLLTVTQKKGNIFYRIIMRKFEFKLILPKYFKGRLRFRNKNGGLYISGGAFADVELSTKNCKFDVDNISCAEFTLKTRNGTVSLKKINASEDVTVKCSNGNVRSENIKTAAFAISCNNAEIYAADITADKLDCSTHNGAVDASAINASDIRLDTSNGKITALCTGNRDDYRLSLETTHGSVTVDGVPQKNITDVSGSAKKRVIASTSNGDIDIKFA